MSISALAAARSRRLALLLGSLTALTVATAVATAPLTQAATMTVDTTVDAHDSDPDDGVCQIAPAGPCSLRAALDEARNNGNVEPDLIALPAGDFRLTLGELHISGAGTVKITGAGATRTTIRQTGPARVLSVTPPGGAPTLHGLTIRGGRLPGDSGNPYGGGIYSIVGIRLDRVVLYDNRVVGVSPTAIANSGGLYVTGPEARLERTRIARNQAQTRGGARLQVGELLIANSIVENNTGLAGEGGLSVFVTKGDGNAGSISNTTIAGNRAPGGEPGGLSGGGSIESPMPPFTIESSLIAGNVAGAGTGGWLLGGGDQATVHNSTFSGNRGGGASAVGAIFKQFGSGPPLLLGSVTLTGGPGQETSSLLGHQGGNAFNLVGTLVDGPCQPTASGIVADSATLFRDASCGGTASGALGLGPLADNGGPSLTHALLPGSPALDGMAAGCLAGDQRGASRPGAFCDVGAFEHGAAAPAAPEGPPPVPDVDGDGIEDLDDPCPGAKGSGADGCPVAPPPSGDRPAERAPSGAAPRDRVAAFNVERARLRRGRIEISGRITPARGGTVVAVVRGRGRTVRYTTRADPQRFRLIRRLPPALRRARSLQLRLRYRGSETVAPAKAALLAARRRARLRAGKVRLDRVTGRLRVSGGISPRARGKVVLTLLPSLAGEGAPIRLRAKVERGRWRVARVVRGLGDGHRRLVVAYRGNRARELAGVQFVRSLRRR